MRKLTVFFATLFSFTMLPANSYAAEIPASNVSTIYYEDGNLS